MEKDLCWLTSSGTSELCCHIYVCVPLFPLSPPATSSPAHPALSCSTPSLIAVVASHHQANRYSLQQVLPSPLQPPAPKQLCSISMIKLVGSVGLCVLLSPLLTSCYFFQETVTRARQLLFYLPITDTISVPCPSNFFPDWHYAILPPFSLVISLFTPP